MAGSSGTLGSDGQLADSALSAQTAPPLTGSDLFEQSPYPMLLVDEEHWIRAANGAFVKLVGYAPNLLLKMRVEELVPSEDAGDSASHWSWLLHQGGGKTRLITHDGEALMVNVNTTKNALPGLHLTIVNIPLRSEHGGMPLLRPLGESAVTSARDDLLSSREQEVLWLVADGATNTQIAYGLGIVEKTVQKHIASIKEKLGASTRAQVVALALRDGIPDTAMTRERTIIHEAVRDATGRIIDSRIRYISHDSVNVLPGIERVLGTPVSTWYVGWTSGLTFRLFVQAIQTGREGRFSRHLMRLPWEQGPRSVEGRVARLGPDRAAFVTRLTSPPIV